MTKQFNTSLKLSLEKLNNELLMEFTNKLNGLRYDMELAVNVPNAVDISLAHDEDSKKVAKRKCIHYCLGDYML